MVERPSRTDPGDGGVQCAQSAQSALNLWRGRLRRARATTQARGGDLAGAEATLASSGSFAASPWSLDLLARIRAQQGRFTEAHSLWTAASELDPDNATYRAGARCAETWQRRRIRPEALRLLLVLAAAALLAFMTWVFGYRWAANTPRTGTTLSTGGGVSATACIWLSERTASEPG